MIHYFLSPLLVAHGFIPVLLSNLLFMVAASYYHYLNFLGYDGKLMTLFVTDKFLLNIGPDARWGDLIKLKNQYLLKFYLLDFCVIIREHHDLVVIISDWFLLWV